MEIDFYILPVRSEERQRLKLACEIIERLFESKQRVVVNLEDEASAVDFDQQLWTFKDLSFLPHKLLGLPVQSPILLTFGYNWHELRLKEYVLVNLAHHLPPTVLDGLKFMKLIDLVADDRYKVLARERYRSYKNKGWKINDLAPKKLS